MMLLPAAFLAFPLAPPFVALNTSAGFDLLAELSAREAYTACIVHMVTQEDEGSCFRASATIVLNALAVPAPVDRHFMPFPYWTQNNAMSSACAASNCTHGYGHCIGAPLNETALALGCEGQLDVRAMHARDAGLASAADLRALLRATVGRRPSDSSREGKNGTDVDQDHHIIDDAADADLPPPTYVIANFNGKPMGLHHGGHYSPVVAYHEARDLALVLDVSRYKYPPWCACTRQSTLLLYTSGCSVARDRP